MPRRYKAQPAKMIALKLPIPARRRLDPDVRKYFDLCDEKIGFLPNVLAAYSFDQAKLRAFMAMYNDLMLGDSRPEQARARDDRRGGLRRQSLLLLPDGTRPGGARDVGRPFPRRNAGDELARRAGDATRQRAMLEFAHLLTVDPAGTGASARRSLRRAGFSDRDTWDIAAVARVLQHDEPPGHRDRHDAERGISLALALSPSPPEARCNVGAQRAFRARPAPSGRSAASPHAVRRGRRRGCTAAAARSAGRHSAA
jgi:alkylhydroperoxidase family enzyme